MKSTAASRRSMVNPTITPYRFERMRIGLFGGSFDPAHSGHRHLANIAHKQLNLHQVWWIPSDRHPFKSARQNLKTRLKRMQMFATGPSMRITCIETQHNISASADLVDLLKRRMPKTRFVWLIGQDITTELHRWTRWTQLVKHIPIAVISRPGKFYGQSRFAMRYRHARRCQYHASSLALAKPPAWVQLNAPFNHCASHLTNWTDLAHITKMC